ncbi:MAG: DUF4230 domain-containing protein [Sinomicrobium sp.]|nr:DUF4230 domain-containing protein [Sinomicrobium sp.]
MRKIGIGFVLALVAMLSFRYCEFRRDERREVSENTQLIQQQLENTGKLVVTEGHYAEVYNYEDQKAFFGEYLTFEKKALVVVNAYVSVSYDLHRLRYEIDEENKTLRVFNVPEEEIRIDPNLKFYDVNDSYFNPFTAEDYNLIQEKVRKSLQDKIAASPLKTNARNRLISELSKLYILTNSLGWTIILDAPALPELNRPEKKDSVLIKD